MEREFWRLHVLVCCCAANQYTEFIGIFLRFITEERVPRVNVIDTGYKCKICEMFPPLLSTGGNARHKFANEAVKSLTDHP